MSFQIGDMVQVIDEDANGEIVGFSNANTALVAIDGFDYPYAITNLMLVEDGNTIKTVIDTPTFETPTPKKGAQVVNTFAIDVMRQVNKYGQPELDLHIEELVLNPKPLSAHKKLQIQVATLEQFISSCVAQSINQFVVIHGVGQGVLKQEVKKVLLSHGNIMVKDADHRLYGSGATHVHIKGLFA